MHKPALAVLLALILQITSAEPEADPQFGHAFVANRLGSPSQQGCQNVAPLPRNACAGKTSSCWSPGVRDTDCPGHGLCCFDGCINVCLGQAAPFVAPVPPPLPPPVVPIRYRNSQKHESTLLQKYVLNEFLTADRSCTTK